MWDKHKDAMSDDILHCMRLKQSNMDIPFSNDIYNESLIRIEKKCIQINNKHINQLGLKAPNYSNGRESQFSRYQKFNVEDLKIYVQKHKQLLNFDQKFVFETIMKNFNNNFGGIFFLDAPGGTGNMK